MSTDPLVTITATAHTECDECDGCAESARIYIGAGGGMAKGRFGSSVVTGGPHWAAFTTEPAPALAEASTQS